MTPEPTESPEVQQSDADKQAVQVEQLVQVAEPVLVDKEVADLPASVGEGERPNPVEFTGDSLGDVLVDWIIHVGLFSAMFFVVALVTAILSEGLHWLVVRFHLDPFFATGFKHVEYTIFALDALFLLGAIILHTIKALKRVGTL